MITIRHFSAGDAVPKVVPAAGWSPATMPAGTEAWIDLEAPTDAELALVRDGLGIHPLALRAASRDHQAPKWEQFDGYSLLVWFWFGHPATAYPEVPPDSTGVLALERVTLLLGDGWALSLHRAPLQLEDYVQSSWRTRVADSSTHEAGMVGWAVLDGLLASYAPLLDELQTGTELMRLATASAFTDDIADRMGLLRKSMGEVERFLAAEEEALSKLLASSTLPSPETRMYLADVRDQVPGMIVRVRSEADVLADALSVRQGVLSEQSNVASRVFTIIGVVLAIGALVTGFFGMNFRYLPFLDRRWGVPLAMGVGILLIGGVLALFRKKGWI